MGTCVSKLEKPKIRLGKAKEGKKWSVGLAKTK